LPSHLAWYSSCLSERLCNRRLVTMVKAAPVDLGWSKESLHICDIRIPKRNMSRIIPSNYTHSTLSCLIPNDLQKCNARTPLRNISGNFFQRLDDRREGEFDSD
jgi:hypothetical protein